MPARTPEQVTEAREAPPAGAAIDWTRLAGTPEFKRLHASRRRYTLGGFALQTGALLVLMALLGFAPDAMGKPAIGQVTWALLGGVAVVVLTFAMALAYAHKSASWEALAERAIADADAEPERERDGRFAR
jgi:uncharacterized membrane protein (DUF485 family)